MAQTATGTVAFCFAAGCSAGVAVPAALAVSEGDAADAAGVFVLADSLGAALGGLFFVLLVPLGGLREAVACFAALACGMAVCTAVGGRNARWTAGLALVTSLAVLGGRLRDTWPQERQKAPEVAREASEGTPKGQAVPASDKHAVSDLIGIPRKVDLERILNQMRAGTLGTNTAAFWNPD